MLEGTREYSPCGCGRGTTAWMLLRGKSGEKERRKAEDGIMSLESPVTAQTLKQFATRRRRTPPRHSNKLSSNPSTATSTREHDVNA